jgi:hypothetical protein
MRGRRVTFSERSELDSESRRSRRSLSRGFVRRVKPRSSSSSPVAVGAPDRPELSLGSTIDTARRLGHPAATTATKETLRLTAAAARANETAGCACFRYRARCARYR